VRASLLCGDSLAVLRTLPDGLVRCCCTSPPYFNLRDYGTATWEGGDAGCDHVEMAVGMSARNTLGPSGFLPQTNAANVGRARQFKSDCGKCGAVRVDAQMGLEATPDAYVARMVELFREVRRVLADDGTLWLNLGDSYAANGPRTNNNGTGASGLKKDGRPEAGRLHSLSLEKAAGMALSTVRHGLKPKDLIGIPWRVAFALQADGWYLRSDIIWHKPNPMPESVKDRPTKAHEYLFLFAKSDRYYFDADAIAEAALTPGSTHVHVEGAGTKAEDRANDPFFATRPKKTWVTKDTRNARTVWTIATKPYAGAHFATMPPELAERCILAGSAPGDTVLDPFGGSGTTASVAVGHGRRAIHIDLNPAYIELARERIGQMLCDQEAA